MSEGDSCRERTGAIRESVAIVSPSRALGSSSSAPLSTFRRRLGAGGAAVELGGAIESSTPARARTAAPRRARQIDWLILQSRVSTAAAQLIQRRVAGNSEKPGSGATATRVEAGAFAVSALKSGRRHFLYCRPVAKQPSRIGVNVVAAFPVELIEDQGSLRGTGLFDGGHSHGLAHIPTTSRIRFRHSPASTSGIAATESSSFASKLTLPGERESAAESLEACALQPPREESDARRTNSVEYHRGDCHFPGPMEDR